jgi:hypothetical protein
MLADYFADSGQRIWQLDMTSAKMPSVSGSGLHRVGTQPCSP